jgi:hypothetical protein
LSAASRLAEYRAVPLQLVIMHHYSHILRPC